MDTKITLETLDKKFDVMSKALMSLDCKIDRVDNKVDAFGRASADRFDAIDQRLVAIDQRFDVVDQRFDAVDQRFGLIDRRFGLIESRFDGRLGAMEDRFDLKIDRLAQMIQNSIMNGDLSEA